MAHLRVAWVPGPCSLVTAMYFTSSDLYYSLRDLKALCVVDIEGVVDRRFDAPDEVQRVMCLGVAVKRGLVGPA